MREVAVRAGKARLAHRQIQRCYRQRQRYSTSPSSSGSGTSSTIQAAPPSSSASTSTISASPSASTSTASPSATSPTSSASLGSSPPKKPAPSAVQRRQRTDLALIVTGTLGLAGLGLYTLKPAPSGPGSATHSQNLSTLSPSSKSFTLPISRDQSRTIVMHSPAKVSEILTANERSYSISRPGNPLYRYDTNSVASNDPCEDTQAFTILEHEGKDFILASVFDGHSGFHTSRLLAETLEKYIARELFEVLKGGYRSLRITNESWWNWLWHKSKEGPKMPAAQAEESEASSGIALNERVVMIPEALRNAYKLADRDIVQSPVDYMRSLDPNSSATGRPSSTAARPPITEEQRLRGQSLMNPALSGACSLSTLIDTSSSSPAVYVAVAGDSRAVMGTFDTESGKWIASVLSEDQTGKSPKEVQRMRAEHPKSEEETVILRGRVLGSLEPTRSLGDAKYKWPVGVQQQLVELFRPTSARMANPALYKTPPYVTANPEVGVYSLGGETSAGKDATSALTQDSGESLVAAVTPPKERSPIKQFIVMATDGLYDCLSSEEVVALVGAHLSGQKTTQTKQELLSVLGTSSTPVAGSVSPHKPRAPPSGAHKGDDATVKRYVFEDSNLSTHLTRNALGGALKEQVSALLSIPAPQCRRYRDDITITVLLFDSEAGQRQAEVKVSEKSELLQGVRRIWEGKERSKL